MRPPINPGSGGSHALSNRSQSSRSSRDYSPRGLPAELLFHFLLAEPGDLHLHQHQDLPLLHAKAGHLHLKQAEVELAAEDRRHVIGHFDLGNLPADGLNLCRIYEGIGRALGALLPVERFRLGVAPPLAPLEARFVAPPEECSGCLVSLGASAG